MGQYIQEGPRHMLETFITFQNCSPASIKVPNIKDAKDNLEYLVEHDLEYINSVATKATMEAHSKGEIECLEISIKDRKPESIAQLLCFFKVSCACLLYTSPSPRDQRGSRMPSSA